jgi:GTP-binding protein HflX
LRFPEDRELILTDTVGFIRNLPKELREAFRATLEELEAADLLLHVADAGHPELEKQIAAVDKILEDMDLHEIPTTLILNKWDTLDNEQKEALMHLYPHAIHVATKNRMGLDEISQEIIDRIDWERDMVN